MKESKAIDMKNKDITIPCLTVGNVGQLCTDLLVTSLEMKRVGYLYHPSIVPLTTSNIYSKDINLACEAYESNNLVSIQLRSSIIPNYYEQFCNDFSDFIKQHEPRTVYLLHSSNQLSNTNRLGEIKYEDEECLSKSPISKLLFKMLKDKGINVKIVNCICYEGDNRIDAVNMYQFLNTELSLNTQMKEVKSWQTSTLWGELSNETQLHMF